MHIWVYKTCSGGTYSYCNVFRNMFVRAAYVVCYFGVFPFIFHDTVDGRTPAPPGMYKTL